MLRPKGIFLLLFLILIVNTFLFTDVYSFILFVLRYVVAIIIYKLYRIYLSDKVIEMFSSSSRHTNNHYNDYSSYSPTFSAEHIITEIIASIIIMFIATKIVNYASFYFIYPFLFSS